MPVKLHRNSRFETIRSQTGNFVLDGTVPPTEAFITGLTGDQTFDSDGSKMLLVGVGATNPDNSTCTLQVWVRDGNDPKGTYWSKIGEVTGLALNDIAAIPVYGASHCFVSIAAVAGRTTATDAVVRAFVQDD